MTAQEQVIKSEMNEIISIDLKLDYKYLLVYPKTRSEGQRLPLIIFLHGSGERGDSVELVKVHGPWYFASGNDDFPFIILAPQCREGETWDPYKLDLFLDKIITRYPIDTNRIYLTGLSRGGFGTWDWAFYRPDRFAAIAPICGASNYHVLNANKLKDIPAWVFHGALDDVIPVEFSTNLVKRIKSLGGDIRFTVYPYAGHDSWTETYMNPELYNWFLSHQKPDR